MVQGLGAIATATGYLIGSFQNLRYPHVHNMADAGEILAGPIGREILGAAQVIFLVFLCASHVLTGLIAFDTITEGASCSVLWAALSAVVCLILTLPRTLNDISYFSVASFISILGESRELTFSLGLNKTHSTPHSAAVLITMIGVGQLGHKGSVAVTSHLPFAKGFLAVTDIIFAYAGHVAFFTFISEMKNPRDFPKTLYLLQVADTTLYVIVGVAIYSFTGPETVSPALGNTGPTLRKTAYGIALPTIMIAGVVNGHVCAKLVFVRIFRRNGLKSRHLSSNTFVGWATWTAICFAIWGLAFLIAEVIPFFNGLLGVISALFASWFTYGISGIFWFHLTPSSERWKTTPQKLKAIFWGCIVLAFSRAKVPVIIKNLFFSKFLLGCGGTDPSTTASSAFGSAHSFWSSSALRITLAGMRAGFSLSPSNGLASAPPTVFLYIIDLNLNARLGDLIAIIPLRLVIAMRMCRISWTMPIPRSRYRTTPHACAKTPKIAYSLNVMGVSSDNRVVEAPYRGLQAPHSDAAKASLVHRGMFRRDAARFLFTTRHRKYGITIYSTDTLNSRGANTEIMPTRVADSSMEDLRGQLPP
ncbi:hypothetical protein NLI96_g5417 [Meripilus lineatus]|uniref:Amino acid transporter transmembrane domain-containing protein n=1 Tax=Meripilus lineatus TaxID=2056292 RepID=A0AAD5V2V9_9APHY|nr:hypothetical protein NLI96_g5417 [Physisporinus lineatus]